MDVCVLGLGYVGVTTAVCLAELGHHVVGTDVDAATLAAVAAGCRASNEAAVPELAATALASGHLRVTVDIVGAVADADVILVCVGTPSAPDGSLDVAALERAADDIGAGLADRDPERPRTTVVFRSTMLPGTCAELLIPRVEKASGLGVGVGFGAAVQPEFLREGSSIADFRAPARLVVGGFDAESADVVAALYAPMPAPVFRVAPTTAEMIKYADNAFHGLKVAFANELGTLAGRLAVDVDELVEVFLADRVLNVSTAYLRPGPAFGGSCLPKDVRALVNAGAQANLVLPVLGGVLASNDAHLDRVVDEVVLRGHRNVGVIGLAYKAGIGDLRESPLVELCTRLRARGFDVRAHDDTADAASRELASLPDLLVGSVDDLLDHADTLVVARADEAVTAALAGSTRPRALIDLVGACPGVTRDERAGRVESSR